MFDDDDRDPTNPSLLTPDERLDEVADILAGAVLRLRARAALPADSAVPAPVNPARFDLMSGARQGHMDTVVNATGEAGMNR